MVRIAVVGAGAPGMSTAVCIKQALPQAHVTVIADKFTKDTTSHGAGGIFRVSNIPNERYRQWVRNGWNWYSSIASGPESSNAGVYFKSGYQLCHKEELHFERFLKELPHYHKLTDAELKLFPQEHKCGYFYTTLITESKYYLPWLMNRFREMGGCIEKRKILSFAELADDYDIVVNCAGYANKWLLNDNKLYAMRGQVFKVKIPWLKHFIYTGFLDTYLLPGKDSVVVGGHRVTERGNESTDIIPEQSKLLWEHACKVLPSLKDAEVVTEWAGIRPSRDEIRVESEKLLCDGKSIQMVHNYGHGGFGICLSWGTAVEATQLVRNLVKNMSKL